MQNILIVEDDDVQRKELYLSIHNNFPNWNIESTKNFEEANQAVLRSLYNNNYFSLFLIDIQLKDDPCDFGGFVLAKEIRSKKAYYTIPILFLTSISEKVQFALTNYHCYNYITKPYSSSDIVYQIQQMLLTGILNKSSITITDINGIKHRISQNNILYIESKSHQVLFVTKTGSITTRKLPFSSVFDYLEGDFVQCHKRYIINANCVDSYDKTNRILQIHQHYVSVSRTYKEHLEEFFKQKNTFS